MAKLNSPELRVGESASMYANNRTESLIDIKMNKSGGKNILDDMNRFLKKRAEKMARDSEMSQINGLVNDLSRV